MATILIIDDLPANRTFLVTLLRHHGHRLLEAGDGSEGLAAVHAEHPDLVITDVLMPVMDGYEFTRRLRLDPATSGIPVVFSTAHYGEREARELALTNGVSAVLSKPIASADVMEIVGRALAGAPMKPAPPEAFPPRSAFDRQHLRLITDKLSEKVGDLKTANAKLRALVNIGLELASERDTNQLLENVCAAARDLFGASYVTLGIVDLHEQKVQRLITCGAEAVSWLKAGDAISGFLATIVAERRTVRGHNPGGDPSTLQLPSLHPAIHAFVAAPIASPDHVYGWFCLVENEGRTFTGDDEDLITALAGQIGRIYENSHFRAVAEKHAEQLQHQVLEWQQAAEALRIAERPPGLR
jgi:CheY-like chemotaxis protein